MLPLEWCLLGAVAVNALSLGVLGWCYLEAPTKWSELVRNHVLPMVAAWCWYLSTVVAIMVAAFLFVGSV